MSTRIVNSTITFIQPFSLPGFDKILPAGSYNLESEDEVLDDMFLPDCLRTSVMIHLHPRNDCPGYEQTLTVPWVELETALTRDFRSSLAKAILSIDRLLAKLKPT